MMYPSCFFHSPPFYNYSFRMHQKNNSSKTTNSEISVNKKENSQNNESAVFELFGIKLFNDDILILSLIFFLYMEKNQDQELFFALVLLLLS